MTTCNPALLFVDACRDPRAAIRKGVTASRFRIYFTVNRALLIPLGPMNFQSPPRLQFVSWVSRALRVDSVHELAVEKLFCPSGSTVTLLEKK